MANENVTYEQVCGELDERCTPASSDDGASAAKSSICARALRHAPNTAAREQPARLLPHTARVCDELDERRTMAASDD